MGTKPISTDLRERVVAAHARGLSRRELNEMFQVSQGSITRWLRQHRSTGNLESASPPGRSPVIPDEQLPLLRIQLQAAPDATLATHAAQWNADHNTTLSSWAIARAIRRLGWSRKKTIVASERDPWTRAAFSLQQAELDASQVVVVDEVGANVDMTISHAWAPIGERAVAQVPRNTPINTTTIASLTAEGMGPALIVSGGVDRLSFIAYLEQVLLPTLHPGQIVVLDNLSAHISTRAQEIVAAAGCRLLYLPPYSPDYSPIELAFAQIKADLRRAAARTPEALEMAIAAALRRISPADARAFFSHCGYRFPPNLDQWFCS